MNHNSGSVRALQAKSDAQMMRRLSSQLEATSLMPSSSSQISENPNAFDCSIVVDGERFWANKMVLARQSIFFYTKFVLEARTEIRLSDIQPNIMRSLLQFCHEDQVDTCGTDEELLYAANACQVTNLKDFCEQRLCNSTTESNLLERWKLANACDAKKLSDKCAQIHSLHQQELQQKVISSLMSNLQLETSDHMSYIS